MSSDDDDDIKEEGDKGEEGGGVSWVFIPELFFSNDLEQ